MRVVSPPPPPSPPPPAPQGSSWAKASQAQVAGDAVASYYASSESQCRDLCFQNAACQFAVLANGVCYLRSNAFKGSSGSTGGGAAATTLWVRPNWGRFYCVDNYDVNGNHAATSPSPGATCTNNRFYTSSVQECRDKCLADGTCYFFIYFTDGRCAVKNNALNGNCGITGPNTYSAYTCFQLY